MKQLQRLHEEFIDKARQPMSFGRLPIQPVKGDVAIVAVDRWETTKDPARMKKTFKFFDNELRNFFVKKLFEYEIETQHNANLNVDEGTVTISLFTKDIDQITDLDKEYAKFADLLYKDVIYGVKTK